MGESLRLDGIDLQLRPARPQHLAHGRGMSACADAAKNVVETVREVAGDLLGRVAL